MISKSQIKLITSLEQKKSRTKNGIFVVEGNKGITELLNSKFELDSLFTTEPVFDAPASKTTMISASDLKKISRLKTSQTAVALFKIPEEKPLSVKGLVVALDGVRDPGNLGTIIRLCDWFGVQDLICSNDTVDCYNPKVIQATMGSISRVNISYRDLKDFLPKAAELSVIGTFLNGDNVYEQQLPENAVLVLGNEANGISKEVEKVVNSKITIPQFGASASTESLNVATATAIFLGEFRRQHNY